METASRSGAGSLPSSYSVDSTSWGLDWTMPMTTTWIDSKADEWDLDVDISFSQSGLVSNANEYFRVFASTRERYPSSERAYDTAVISSTVAHGSSTLYTVAGVAGYGFATTGTGACTEAASPSTPASLGACMALCDATGACDAIQWDGTNCKQLDCPATPALVSESGEQTYTKAAHGATSMVLPHYTFSSKMVYLNIDNNAFSNAVTGQFIVTKSEKASSRSVSADPTVSASGCVSSTDPAVDTCSTNGNCIDDPDDGKHPTPYCICSEGFSGTDCSVEAFSTATTISTNANILGLVATDYDFTSSTCKTRNTFTDDDAGTGAMQASGQLNAGESDQDGYYVGMTIATATTTVATGVITSYTGATRAFTATWSSCTPGTCASDNTPTMDGTTTYTIDLCTSGNTWNAGTSTCNRKTAGTQNVWEPFILIGTGQIQHCQQLPNLVIPTGNNPDCKGECNSNSDCNAYEFKASDTCKLFSCPKGSAPATTSAATSAGSWGVDGTAGYAGYYKSPFTCCGVAETATPTACGTVVRGYYDEASCESVPGITTKTACEAVAASTQATCVNAPVTTSEDACELKPYEETPSSACSPAAIAAGYDGSTTLLSCDAFDVVPLDCSTQKCTPTGTNPYKIGYVTCPGGVCTINAPKPIVEIPFTVSGLPAYSKVVAYVDSQPYPSKGANSLHYVNNCESSDKACVASATATSPPFDDSTIKIYDLKPLSAGKKHTVVLMLLTDSGEPLGTVLKQFEVGYGGGCAAAPDGSVCGGQGACYLGYCVCYDGYFGTNCERTIDEDGSVCAAQSGVSSSSCTAAGSGDANYNCVWDSATSLCKISVVMNDFTAGSVYETRQTQLTQSKLGEARFLNTRMLEANAAAISKSDLSLSTGTAGTKTKLENAASSVYTTVEAAKVATQAKVDALYAKTERNAIKIQQAKEESLRLQTTELEAKLEMQRSLAEHQTVVQNRFQSKRFDVYKLNALKQDKLKQEFARSRFTLNQLLTSNGPTVDPSQFTESTCTTDQFYNVECTETVTDKSAYYTGTGYVSDQTTPEYTGSGTLASPTVSVVGGADVDGEYNGAGASGVNRGR
jgi:hypothetical protein